MTHKTNNLVVNCFLLVQREMADRPKPWTPNRTVSSLCLSLLQPHCRHLMLWQVVLLVSQVLPCLPPLAADACTPAGPGVHHSRSARLVFPGLHSSNPSSELWVVGCLDEQMAVCSISRWPAMGKLKVVQTAVFLPACRLAKTHMGFIASGLRKTLYILIILCTPGSTHQPRLMHRQKQKQKAGVREGCFAVKSKHPA